MMQSKKHFLFKSRKNSFSLHWCSHSSTRSALNNSGDTQQSALKISSAGIEQFGLMSLHLLKCSSTNAHPSVRSLKKRQFFIISARTQWKNFAKSRFTSSVGSKSHLSMALTIIGPHARLWPLGKSEGWIMTSDLLIFFSAVKSLVERLKHSTIHFFASKFVCFPHISSHFDSSSLATGVGKSQHSQTLFKSDGHGSQEFSVEIAVVKRAKHKNSKIDFIYRLDWSFCENICSTDCSRFRT